MNLCYETARKLKDANFPQKIAEFGLSHYYIETGRIGYLTHDGKRDILAHEGDYSKNWAKIPTLSELIEACDALVENCVYLSGHKDQWVAVDGRDGFGMSEGATPEEAVANLWLALHHE